jgi:hypothetical protein
MPCGAAFLPGTLNALDSVEREMTADRFLERAPS